MIALTAAVLPNLAAVRSRQDFGRLSSGKTRSLYEAVLKIAPNWPVAQPSSTQEIIDRAVDAVDKSVIRLDEMQRFLGSTPYAAERLPALLTAEKSDDPDGVAAVADPRVFGLDADPRRGRTEPA